jgi:hypothetical protein
MPGFMSNGHHSFPCMLCKPLWEKKKPSMHVPIGYRLLKKLPMPMPSGLHKWFKKKLSYPHGMIKNQYPANIGINLTDGLKSLWYNARKDSFPCNNQSWTIFLFWQTKSKFCSLLGRCNHRQEFLALFRQTLL